MLDEKTVAILFLSFFILFGILSAFSAILYLVKKFRKMREEKAEWENSHRRRALKRITDDILAENSEYIFSDKSVPASTKFSEAYELIFIGKNSRYVFKINPKTGFLIEVAVYLGQVRVISISKIPHNAEEFQSILKKAKVEFEKIVKSKIEIAKEREAEELKRFLNV